MTAHQDMQSLLARARAIAEAEKCSGVATVAGGQPGNRAGQAPRNRTPLAATPATPLQTGGYDPWSAEEWSYRFHERAGSLEHDCGLSRHDAERRALEELQGHWRALHPMPPSGPEIGCVQCGHGAGDSNLVPHLAAGKGAFWLHADCWPAFDQARCEEAQVALRKLLPEVPACASADQKQTSEAPVRPGKDRL
jgi:hypothetical protein